MNAENMECDALATFPLGCPIYLIEFVIRNQIVQYRRSPKIELFSIGYKNIVGATTFPNTGLGRRPMQVGMTRK